MKRYMFIFYILVGFFIFKSCYFVLSYLDHNMFGHVLLSGFFVGILFHTYAMPHVEDLVDRQWFFPESWRVERDNADLDNKLFIIYEYQYKLAFILLWIVFMFKLLLYSQIDFQDLASLLTILILEIYITDINKIHD